MRPIPIRWKITLWAASATGSALLAFTGALLINLYRDQMETADLTMQSEARHLVSANVNETVFGTWLQTIPSSGPILACSIDPANERFLATPPPLPTEIAQRAFGHPKPVTLQLRDGNWRVRSYHLGQHDVLLAYDLYDVTDRVTDLLAACLFAFPIGSIVAALGAWFVAGWALTPVRTVTETAATIEAGALALRLPPSQVNDEIGRLTTVFNQMLGRLEKSFRQADRFAADASHELRTPLTIMQGEIEALLIRTDLTPAVEAKLLSQQEEIARLNRITEQLLLLARFDAGYGSLVRESLDLSALVNEACEDAEFLADASHIKLDRHIKEGVSVSGDFVQLRRVVLNLLDNACKFNVHGGCIRCTLEGQDTFARLIVSNTGPGIPPESRPRLFDRFFRVDASRNQSGHGLGLSLCREIIEAHGGGIRLSENITSGLTEFVATLPLSQTRTN